MKTKINQLDFTFTNERSINYVVNNHGKRIWHKMTITKTRTRYYLHIIREGYELPMINTTIKANTKIIDIYGMIENNYN